MSTPSAPSTVEVQFKLHLEHMDLGFSVADGKVQMAPGDFTQLLEVARPKHAGLFGDTLKKVLELAGQPSDSAVAPSVRRRMFDAVASVEDLRGRLDTMLQAVAGELARLTALPPIFDDEDEPKAAPLAAAQPTPQPSPVTPSEAAPAAPTLTETADTTPAASTPTAAAEPAAPTPHANG